jgi:hypothetical protein
MRRWFLWIVVSLLASGFASRSVNAEQTPRQSAANGPNHSHGLEKSAHEQGQGGILYGPGYAFLISAPKGWIMDDQAGQSQGVPVVFYHRGESWLGGDPTMYVNLSYKVKGQDDTIQKVIQYDIEQTRKQDPEMKAEAAAPLQTGDGRKAVVYTFSGPGRGRSQEQVAYLDTPQVVMMLVLSARTEATYKAALPDYLRLVRSFAFLANNVDIQPSKPHTADRNKKSR